VPSLPPRRAQVLGLCTPWEWAVKEFDVIKFFCFSVTLLNGKVYGSDFAMGVGSNIMNITYFEVGPLEE